MITKFDNVTAMIGNAGRPVVNQFILHGPAGVYFKSYHTIIAFKPYDGSPIQLDRDRWDISVTTGKYRNIFLGEDKKTTEKKIKSGEYKLVDLN